MQPVNDDMEDLFRRAADSYPLRTDGADFEKVRQQMEAEKSLPERKSAKKRYLWFLLLLLIPSAFLVHTYFIANTNSNNQIKHNHIDASTKEAAKTVDNYTTKFSSKDSVQSEIVILDKKNVNINTTTHTTKIQQLKNSKPIPPSKNFNTSNYSSANKKQQVEKNNKQWKVNDTIRLIVSLTKQHTFNKLKAKTVLQSANTRKIKNNNFIVSESGNTLYENLFQNKPKATDTTLNNTPAYQTYNEVTKAINKSLNEADSNSLSTTNTVTKNKDSAFINLSKRTEDSAIQIVAQKASNKTKVNNKSTIYIGIIGGPDASTVKSNRSGGTGLNAGFIAGYQTGRHLAFETGILWNYKKYYADGKHVSVEKLGLLQHTNLLYLDGTCGMFEIPINIRYYFATKGKHNWYTGVGLSSYIMKKENYDYRSVRYNVEYYSEKEYRNTTNNWWSVFQFNVGYQVRINKIITMRIEPYAKFPLKGLGIGKLPLSSAGVNVGLMLPIH